MIISNPSSNPVTVNIASTVYNGAAPVTWTDLDLSSYVGLRPTLCFLRVRNTAVIASTIAFRTNGDTGEYYDVNTTNGVALIDQANINIYNMVAVVTSSTGIIEWISEAANNTNIVLMSYVN